MSIYLCPLQLPPPPLILWFPPQIPPSPHPPPLTFRSPGRAYRGRACFAGLRVAFVGSERKCRHSRVWLYVAVGWAADRGQTQFCVGSARGNTPTPLHPPPTPPPTALHQNKRPHTWHSIPELFSPGPTNQFTIHSMVRYLLTPSHCTTPSAQFVHIGSCYPSAFAYLRSCWQAQQGWYAIYRPVYFHGGGGGDGGEGGGDHIFVYVCSKYWGIFYSYTTPDVCET